jgi:gliding motility-associated-like protein
MSFPLHQMLKGFVGVVALILVPFILSAQTDQGQCGADRMHRLLMEKDPDYKMAVERFELDYQHLLRNPSNITNRSTGCAGEARRVPVVVHVIHLAGEAIGTGSNIADAQIISAIQGLNDRWQAIIGDGAGFDFEFCLAKRSPTGQPTTGIVRVNGSGVSGYSANGLSYGGSPGASESEIKALSTWPQSEYYNIWLVHDIGGPVAGFAYFPNGGPLDGTVLESGYMTYGSTTLTHELGHGFALSHTFEGDNDGANCPPDNDCTVDGDRVCDTPPHKVGDCGPSNPCPGGGIWDNSRKNYMSYCGGTTRFTDGQGIRVNAAAYGGARLSLFSSEGCIPADQATESGITRIVYPNNQPLCDSVFAPQIEIKNYGSTPLITMSIEAWIDGVLYNTTAWTGNIPTGTLAIITLDPITVALGPHDIDYRIVDNNGAGIDSYVDNNQLCTYLYYEPVVKTIPSCWDFESGSLPGSWTVNGPLISVEPYANPACVDQGTHSVVFNAFNASAGGSGTQTLMTVVPFDLTGLPGAALNFDVAMRKNYYADYTTTLEVLVSSDCGQNYTPVYLRKDTYSSQTEDLHTVPAPADVPTSSWKPTSCADWRRDIADLSAFKGQEVLVAFRMTIDRSFGENLYIDNICVQSCDGFAEITAINGPGICVLDTAVFQVTSGSGVVHKWFKNEKPIIGASDSLYATQDFGKYYAAIEVGGCRFTTDTFEMFYFPAVIPKITGDLVVCTGDSAILDAGAGFVHYLWSNGDTTQVIKTPVTGNYSVTVTSTDGCTGATFTQVANIFKPNATISGALGICEGQSTTLAVSPFFTNVLWSTGDTTNSIMVTSTGTYSVTVTGSNGCFDVDQVTVSVNQLPDPKITGVLAICSGESTILDAGPGYSQYKWSNGPTSQTITVSAAGTYSVTVTDALGCKGDTTVSIVENIKPQTQITGATSFCAGSSTLLEAVGSFNGYLWSTGEMTPGINVTQTGVYSVTVSTSAGCTGTDQFSVTALPAPSPQITGDLDLCEGETTTLNAGNNFTSYLWPDGSSAQTLVVFANGHYIVTVTNSIGCPGYDTVNVVISSLPEPQISGTLAICEGDQTLLDAGAGYTSYLWSNGSASQTLNVNAAGTYSVTVTTGAGCIGSSSVSVQESLNPVPDIIGDSEVCIGENSTLNAGPGYTGYLWSNGLTTPVIDVTISGTYGVTVTNAAGCSGKDAFTVTVHPKPTPMISGNLSFCDGNSTTLSLNNPYPKYQWSTGSAASQVTVTQAGTTSVTVTDINGCSASTQVLITVLSLVNPSVTSIPSAVCPGEPVQLVASGGTDYLWIQGASQVSNPNIANPTITLQTSTTLSVEVSNACNSETVTIDLVVNTPQGMAGPGQNVLIGKEITLSASGGATYTWSGPTDLSCTICPDPQTTPESTGYYYVDIQDINGCRTRDSVFVEVFDDLERVLDLVNTITPNGDGHNDELVIKGLESFDANSLTIYNRWGEQIFHQDNYDNTFNGYHKGKLLPAGSYYYVLRLWPGDRVFKSVLVILHED